MVGDAIALRRGNLALVRIGVHEMSEKQRLNAGKGGDAANFALTRNGRLRRIIGIGRHRVVSNYLFGDFIYAVLPLVVLTLVSLLVFPWSHFWQRLGHFLMLKEWSFATIVLFGTAIRRFVRLKAEIQRDTSSYKLEMGLQLLVILLIIAVVILCLVILHEKQVFPDESNVVLGLVQVGLFVVSAISLLLAIRAEDQGINWIESVRGDKTPVWFLDNIHRQLEPAERHVRYVVTALDHYHAREFPKAAGQTPVGREQQRRLQITDELLDGIQELVGEMPQIVGTV